MTATMTGATGPRRGLAPPPLLPLDPNHSLYLATQIGASNHRAFVLTLSWAALVSLIVLEQSRRALGTDPCPTTLPAADGEAEGEPSPLASLLSKSTAAALASAAVPLLFVPKLLRVREGSAPFIDGSTPEGVPLYSVVRKWDADRAADAEHRSKLTIIYVKLTEGSERASRGCISKLRLLRAVASAGVESMHDRTVDLLGYRPDVEIFGMQLEAAGADFFETRNIPDCIRIAKESFSEQLGELEAQLRRNELATIDPVGAAG